MEVRVSDETGFFQEKDDCDGVIKVDEILWIIPTEFYFYQSQCFGMNKQHEYDKETIK